MTASGTVLILTPLKDATAHLDGYLANLRRLTYPNKRISLGLLESDSADETYLAFEQRVPDLRTKFRSIGLWKRDFGYRLPTHVHRWAPTVLVMRRAVLARSRNHLLFRALDDQDWVRPEEISLFRSVYGSNLSLSLPLLHYTCGGSELKNSNVARVAASSPTLRFRRLPTPW